MPDASQQPAYRPMTEADVQVTAYVRKAAIESVALSEGRRPDPWQPRAGTNFEHMVRTDPGGSWVAEISGLVVGYAQSFVRGDIWFLSQLFVQPDVHGQHAGGELLRRAIEYGRHSGARIFSVVASTSPVAQSLYMRAGMLAIGIGYRLEGGFEALRDALPEPAANRKRVVDCAGWQDRIAELDAAVFGAERREDHAHYLANRDHAFALTEDGKLVGYGYVDERGIIGPIAAWQPDDQLPLLRMAVEHALSVGHKSGGLWVLSLNPTMMSATLEAGWKIESWTFFLSSAPFGQFDRYHPSGGMLL